MTTHDTLMALESMLEQCCFGDTSKINHLELALAVREVLAERDQLQTCVSEWVAANGPLGWISDLRAERDALAKDAARFRWSMEHDDRHGYNFRKAYSAWDGNDSFVDFIDQLMKGPPT